MPETPLLSHEQARANRLITEWDDYEIASPWFLGRRTVDVPLTGLVPFIDWPGPGGRELHGRAGALLDRIVTEKLLTARGVYGFWPANTHADDIVLFANDDRRKELARFPMLRQQQTMADGPNLSLADYIAPRESGVPDYVGMFVVTAGIGVEELLRHLDREQEDDDGRMVEAVAVLLAEAFAEHLHAQARRDWGYGERERLTTEQMIAGKYRGLRVPFGSPACPDRSGRFKLFELLRAQEQGITLTDSAAMRPAASVSGLYFSHPGAAHFHVGRLGEDQLESYAARKGLSVEDVRSQLPGVGV